MTFDLMEQLLITYPAFVDRPSLRKKNGIQSAAVLHVLVDFKSVNDSFRMEVFI